MITGYEAFTLYNGIKLHFTTDSYDFFKYNGKTKISVEAFENRKDKWHFYKLSRRLSNKDDLIDFLVANFVHDENIWVGNLLDEQSDTIYRQRQKVIQSISYTFQSDCERLFADVSNPNAILQSDNGDYPVLLTKTLRKDVQIETLCILNRLLNFLPRWNKVISDNIRWPLYSRKIIKYTPFMPQDDMKFKLLLKKVLK